MSDNTEVVQGHQGRPWKVEATFKDYEPAKSLSERFETSGLESKVRRTRDGFTVRTRTSPSAPAPESTTKSKRKNK
jgi:hypothetical protein